MTDVVRDIHNNVTMNIVRIVDDKQKGLRKGVVRMIDVSEDDKKSKRAIHDKKEEKDVSLDLFSLESLRYWDVKMPPVKKKRFGLPVPVGGVKGTMHKVGLGNVFNKKRRITIELYKKITPAQAKKNKEQERRVFQKLHPRASMVNVEGLQDTSLPPLDDEDFIIFRILKEMKPGAKDWHDDDSETTAMPNGALESHKLKVYDATNYGDGYEEAGSVSQWKERHRSRISTVKINKFESHLVELKLRSGADGDLVRELCFKDPHEVETFLETFSKMQELMTARGDRLAAERRMMILSKSPPRKKKESNVDDVGGTKKAGGLLSSLTFGRKEEEECYSNIVNLLVEIVSATNLPVADLTSSDPYVCVEDGRNQLHKTDVVPNTLHPVWTLSTGAMFLIQTTLTEFFQRGNNIEFIVKDYDTVGANDTLGYVLVKKRDLLEGNGERVEYVLNPPKRQEKKLGSKKKFYLTLRYKKATKYDIDFLRSYEAKKKTGMMSALGLSRHITGVFADDCYLPPRFHHSNFLKKTEKQADNGIGVKYRLKPFPDPSREVETKWMSEQEIQAEVDKPSREWTEAGSGSVGKFYLEILGCDGLPNRDFSITGRNKSDPFVLIAFEDCVVNTDVINDCLAPRWMPWTQRAFVFNVMHPSSQFYISVMDYEELKGHHDKLGRVVVNPTNLRPNTTYTMRYSILDSDEIGRKAQGKIRFRLRFESSNERAFLLSTFQWRKDYYVSTNVRADSKCMSFALTNDYDRYYLSLETIQKYLDEIIDYQLYIDDIVQAFKVVFLWRGHFPLKFPFFGKTFTVKAPFHSMTAFTWAILLSMDFDRFGSFLCFSVAWTLFATLEVQRGNPNPWKRPRTYIDLLGVALFNKSFAYHKIDVNENIDDIITFDERRNDLMKLRKEIIETNWKRNEQEELKLQKENKEIEKQSRDQTVGLSYAPSRLFLGPFQDILVPTQKILYKTCVYCRISKSVIVWSDSIVSFWVATIALGLTALLFFVPWTFLFRWAFRVASITLLGPWMKLVDIFFVEHDDHLTYEERKAKAEAEMQQRYDFVLSESRMKRLYKERNMKIRDMEKYLFGQYGVRVPLFKEERFASTPLSGGSAEPYDPASMPPPKIIRRINGQVLSGDMIMKRQDPASEFKLQKKVPTSMIPTVINTEDEMAPLIQDKDDEYPYGALDV